QSASLQGVTFQVKATGEGSLQQLVVKASENGKPLPVVETETDGHVTGMEVEDLNSDGKPELVVYVTSAGSGSYGSVKAWTVSKGHTLLPINMPELSGKWAKGYMGHDSFAVVETSLMRKFPVYRPSDSNAKPTGGICTITYKLVPGEASWQFKPVSSNSY
ncbi:MAG: PliI family lysozyme inhibitor of I-type lysozyme, partial [Vulcanococcus sp.]